MRRNLNRLAVTGSVFHTHGLWLLPNIYPYSLKRSGRDVRVIHSPRGMLAAPALAISARKKRLLWWIAQRQALQGADCLHVTAESEYEEVRAAGILTPVAIIPNGIHIPAAVRAERKSANRTVLSLGRIHPKKGLDRLLKAWALVEREKPNWSLRIVGPSEVGTKENLLLLVQKLSLSRVKIEAPQFGEGRAQAFDDADLFVLPSINENFGMTVAEAQAAGVPVIASKGAPWSGLIDERSGWWVNTDPAEFANALREAMSLPTAALVERGQRGRGWMAREFGWAAVAAQMTEVYNWVVTDGAPTPSSLRQD
jgi:glycosyltransferase involved in cell wall biosynthesis